MTPRQRFGVWIGATLAAVAAPLLLHIDAPSPAFLAATCALAGLSVELLLLATTPPDAIRLPLWMSSVIIAAGAASIAAVAGASAGTVAGLGIGALLITPLSGRHLFGQGPFSPWCFALVLWHPVFWLIPEVRESGVHGDAESLRWIGSITLLFAVAAITRLPRSAQSRWVLVVSTTLGWAAAGATALWLALRYT